MAWSGFSDPFSEGFFSASDLPPIKRSTSRVSFLVHGPAPEVDPVSMRFFWPLDLPPKLAQLLCDFSGLVSLAREGPRRQITERRVRPSGVVVLSPTFDPVSGVVHR